MLPLSILPMFRYLHPDLLSVRDGIQRVRQQ